MSSLNITPATKPSAGSLVSPSNVQPDIQIPTVIAYTLRIERQIGPSTSLTVAYVGSHGYHQILSEDQNEPGSVRCPNVACPAGLAVGTYYYTTTVKANPLVANTTSWVSGESSNYNGLEVDLRRSFAGGLQFRANYTFSKNLDNGSAWNTSVSANTPAFVAYPNNPALDYGPAATDVRNLLAINGSYELPFGTGRQFVPGGGPLVERLVWGFTLSTIANVQTGFPFTPQLGYNPTGSGDTRNPVRPDVNPNFRGTLYPKTVSQYFNPAAFQAPANGAVGNLGRDTLTGPGYVDWDLSLAKVTRINERVRTQFRAEFFNVLNHTNFATPNAVVLSSATVGSPTAGVITGAGTSRQIQLELKVLF